MFCSFLFVLPSSIITNRMLELHGMNSLHKEIRNTKEKRVKKEKRTRKQKSRNISGMKKLVNFSKLLAFQEISVNFLRFLELGMIEIRCVRSGKELLPFPSIHTMA